jgi:formate-dependent nitrite reductase membrane component NrfD
MSVARDGDSVDPVRTDGRDIDTRIAELSGEGGQQEVWPTAWHMAAAETGSRLPAPRPHDPTYYDRPMLKASVWKPYIPLYFYIGGAAGASLALGAAAQLHGSRELDRLVRRCHWIGIFGSTLGAVLLTADLGRPERFIFMLRVFRPTSPMNLGSWIIAGAPAVAITAGLFARRGPFPLLGDIAGYVSGLFGLALATYTGVLISNTAVPLWQASRGVLPVLFGASGVAASAALFDLLYEDRRARAITRTFGIAGRTAELAAGFVMECHASRVPEVGRPLKRGLSGLMWRTAAVLTGASLVTLLLPNQNRKKRVVAGALGTAGSLLLRFAVDQAGKASAANARASFHQQRAGYGGAEVP